MKCSYVCMYIIANWSNRFYSFSDCVHFSSIQWMDKALVTKHVTYKNKGGTVLSGRACHSEQRGLIKITQTFV